MKLYMKQKFFSLKDRAAIKDEAGNDKYTVEGKIISVGKKLRIYNMQGEEVAFLKETVLSLMPRFTIEMNGEEVAQVRKKFTFLKAKYEVFGPDWQIRGSLMDHDYMIYEGERPVVSIHKKWLSWGDAYELDIEDESKEVLALAVVLAIDAVLDAQAAAASVSASN